MSQQENEPDNPNVVAVYIIIVISLLTVLVSIWSLAEYKGHLDKKLQDSIQQSVFEQKQQLQESEAANQAIVEQQLKDAKIGDFKGL